MAAKSYNKRRQLHWLLTSGWMIRIHVNDHVQSLIANIYSFGNIVKHVCIHVQAYALATLPVIEHLGLTI